MSTPRKIPINRVNKFFSNEDFDLDISMGREAIEGDGNFTVILYRVDRENTSSDDLYGEAPKDGVKFFPPVELKVIPTLDEAENKAYNNGVLDESFKENIKSYFLEIVPLISNSYFMSEDFGLVDCSLAPLLWRTRCLGLEINENKKIIDDYSDRIFDRESFQASLTETEQDM